MRTININDIGPFFESGRLRGTPPDDDCREVLRCDECLGIFPSEVVSKYCGKWLCDKCCFAAMAMDTADKTDDLAPVDGELICSTCEELIEAAAGEKKGV